MAYRVTSARQEQFSQQRERLLELALERVSAAGFAGLTMQGLAERAGIATGSLYRYFRNKSELAAELFARASQREVDALAEVLGGWARRMLGWRLACASSPREPGTVGSWPSR